MEKYTTIWTKIEVLKITELNNYIKTKIRTYDDKIYTYFRGLNMLEDGVECEPFTVISLDSLLVYEEKYCLQVYLDNSANKIVDKHMTGYLNLNIF